MPVTIQRVVECVREAEKNTERMVIIVGKPGSGKSKVLRELATMRGWVYMDSRKLLDEEFLELPPKARAAEAPVFIGREFERKEAEVILLDNIQSLFTPLLHIEPLEVLKYLSRKHTIVLAWPGEYNDGKLSIGRNPGENQEYLLQDITVVQIG